MRPHLGPKERQVYDALRAAAGGIVSRTALVMLLYGGDWLPSDEETVRVHIYHLRKKGYAIENVRGLGYRLTEDRLCPLCGQERPG